MKLTNVLVSGALALSLLAQPAVAGTTPRSATVQTADLNLDSPQGRATLEARVQAAVGNVCAPNAQYPLVEMRDYQRCTAEASESAKLRTVELIAAGTKTRTLARR